MSLADDTPPDLVHEVYEQLQHDLKTPLTTIHGRAQLLTRMVRRSPSLTEPERGALLDGLVSIETTVRAMVIRIDRIGRGDDDRLLGPKAVAERLGVQTATVARWCRSGRLRCLKPGKSWRVRQSILEAFVQRGQPQPTPPA
jgi:excisionase family DNA binding protein